MVALVAGGIGALVGSVTALGTQQTVIEKFFPTQSVIGHPVDAQAILAKVEPAVVSIDTTLSPSASAASGGVIGGAGTGMILTPQGEVLTNNHVVAGSSTVTVTLFGQTSAMAAHVIGTDPSLDLALVQIDGGHDLPTVDLGNSNAAQVGDSVLAIGNALALAGGPTVTSGIVSALDRSLSAESDLTGSSESLTGLIQTDAPINPGNSGGPLVNAEAQVIGMNTAVASSSSGNAPAQNIGFAIPIASITPQLAGLQQGGTGGTNGGVVPGSTGPGAHAYIGAVVATVTPSAAKAQNLSTTSGAEIIGLDAGGPAASAHMAVGDVIVGLAGTRVTSASSLVSALDAQAPGDTVTVTAWQGATERTFSVTLGSSSSG